MKYTRKDYLDKKCTHSEYYNQFITHEVIRLVESFIGVKSIKNSKDPHFNDIPLRKWDDLHPFLLHGRPGRLVCEAAGRGGYSLSDTVCVAKEAARIIKNRTKNNL